MAISSLSAANTEICDGQQLSNVPKNFRRLIMTSLQCRLTPVTGNHTLAQWMLLTSITLRPEPVNSARLRSPPKYSQPCTAELSALRTKYYNESYDYLLGLGSMQMQTLSQLSANITVAKITCLDTPDQLGTSVTQTKLPGRSIPTSVE